MNTIFKLHNINTETLTEEITDKAEDQKDNMEIQEKNPEIITEKKTEDSFKAQPLLNMGSQEIPMMNGTKTKRIGTVLRFLGDSYFISESSTEEIKEFIKQKIEPVKDNYNYIVVDFLPSDTGLIYRFGIIEYGKLHKENKDFYFEKQEDIYGTFITYDDNDIKNLINTVKQKDGTL